MPCDPDGVCFSLLFTLLSLSIEKSNEHIYLKDKQRCAAAGWAAAGAAVTDPGVRQGAEETSEERRQ